MLKKKTNVTIKMSYTSTE